MNFLDLFFGGTGGFSMVNQAVFSIYGSVRMCFRFYEIKTSHAGRLMNINEGLTVISALKYICEKQTAPALNHEKLLHLYYIHRLNN